jgi:iron complex outermembrane receptor protein
MYSLDASITKVLAPLPGGDLALAVGGQVRKEKLENNNQNAALDTYTLTTSSAFGEHTVTAAFFELDAPVHEKLDLNVSGRYDHYSEGFGRFSPKFGAKFAPIRQLQVRGTYSRGFRAPTFGESGPLSSYAGFSGFTPPASFQLQHGGLTSAPTNNTNAYAQTYNLGGGYAGNPNLKPETSRSFTAGIIIQPTRWISMTVDYYNIKKKNLIVAGPDAGAARTAYYSQSNSTAGCAAVAAVGPGYSCNLLDAVDPLFPNAMPRVLIINSPFVNANSSKNDGIDYAVTANFNLPYSVKWYSHAEVTHVMTSNLITDSGQVQKYAGTLGPYDLSSGNGTPRIRGNWQNTFDVGRLSLSATIYYVGKIKSVATDQRVSNDCVTNNQYATGNTALGEQFCYIKKFISVDGNVAYEVRDGLQVYGNIGNMFDAKAPIAPGAYASAPNYLITFHGAGAVGRTFKAGVRFQF